MSENKHDERRRRAHQRKGKRHEVFVTPIFLLRVLQTRWSRNLCLCRVSHFRFRMIPSTAVCVEVSLSE